MGIVEELRWTAAKLLTIRKFAVDSAVNESLVKGSKHAFAVVREKSKGEIPSHLSNGDKKQNYLLVEEMQAKLEKMQDDMNVIKQQDEISACSSEEEQEHLKKFSEEPPRSSVPEATQRRKIFIRSRL